MLSDFKMSKSLNICSEQSEQSGRPLLRTDPPPESFLIPQQLAVPPVPQFDDVPCPKTIGEPVPEFPESGHVKYINFLNK